MGVTILVTVLLTTAATILILNLRAGEKHITYQLEHRFGIDDPQFVRTMGQLLGPAILHGNEVKALHNGDEIFPVMLAAIRLAQKSITFETYIYWSGEIGKQFSDALCERAENGVKVHVLLDWVGTGKIDSSYLDQMKAAGVEVERYHPLNWYTLARINNRTHRKLLVVDGKIGFTGGGGIADLWTGDAQSPDHWRDSHFQIRGPAVAQMQAAFNDNWIKTRAERGWCLFCRRLADEMSFSHRFRWISRFLRAIGRRLRPPLQALVSLTNVARFPRRKLLDFFRLERAGRSVGSGSIR